MSNEFQQRFGERLRQERRRQGLTQADLAERVGWVKPGSISQWETGRALPRVDHLYRLAQVLWCSVDWLLGSDRLGQTQIEQGSGWRWRISKPYSDNPAHRRQLEDGIVLLRKLTIEGRTSTDIRSQTPFSGLTEAHLIHLLDTVLLSRAVELVDVERNGVAEQQLKKKFGKDLLNCIVSNVDVRAEPQLKSRLRTEAVAFLAARDAIALLPAQGNVGLTGGSQVSRMVHLIPPALPQLAGISWLPLLRSKLPPTARTDYNSPNSVVARMVQWQPGTRGYRLPFIPLQQRGADYLATTSGSQRSILQHAGWVLEQTQDCIAAFLSVHSSQYGHRLTDALEGLPDLRSVLDQFSEEERARHTGNILLYLVDENGKRVGNELERRANDEVVYSIGLEGLRRIARNGSVWILADMAHKAPVVRAALRGRLATSLVLDASVSKALLST